MNWILCIDNGDYKAALEPRKLYQKLDDAKAELLGMVRVIDESGEDYLYDKQMFIEMPVIVNSQLDEALAV